MRQVPYTLSIFERKSILEQVVSPGVKGKDRIESYTHQADDVVCAFSTAW